MGIESLKTGFFFPVAHNDNDNDNNNNDNNSDVIAKLIKNDKSKYFLLPALLQKRMALLKKPKSLLTSKC